MKKRLARAASMAVATGMICAFTTLDASAQCGRASWYALTSKTASGERMNASLLTAAHRSLPFGTKVRVTNRNNGKSVVVRINDRGPFKAGRVIDLSERAAEEIGMTGVGVTPVKLEVLGQ